MSFNNFHMHTTFCDGADTPKTMAEAAFAAGCEQIGFSGHSFLEFDPDWNMAPEAAARYREVVASLKEAYAPKKVFLGIEQDYCSSTDDLPLYDYVIGGVHCVFKDGHYISVDLGAEAQREGVEQWYEGDADAFVEDYYEMVGDLYEKTHCDIIAHFDLVTKFLERDDLIDVDSPRYIAAEDKALQKIIACPAVVEINTGAISRGYRKEPYPSERILKKLGEAGKPVILSSDSHGKDTILYGFEDAMALVEKYDLRRLTTMEEVLTLTRGRSD
ncbi:MAG: histidinol-phosphatase [Clostridia bacterium]|nr:histidinol-phosphatase [Clostridia bacterium]